MIGCLLVVAAACGRPGAPTAPEAQAAVPPALAQPAAAATPLPPVATPVPPGVIVTALPVEDQPLTPPVPSWTPSSEATPTLPPGVATAAAVATSAAATTVTAAAATATATAPVEILIRNFAFEPATQSVRAGQMVVWRNLDGVVHTVSFQGTVIESGRLEPGFTYASPMHRPGTWVYHCSIHPSMTGRVIVSP